MLLFFKCNPPTPEGGDFPATHGLHAVRGQYTEISTLDYAGGVFRVESGTTEDPHDGGTYAMLVTTLKPAAAGSTLRLTAEVPAAWSPKVCSVSRVPPSPASSPDSALVADCPGLPTITMSTAHATQGKTTTNAGAPPVQLELALSSVVGGAVSAYAYISPSADPMLTTAAIVAGIAERR